MTMLSKKYLFLSSMKVRIFIFVLALLVGSVSLQAQSFGQDVKGIPSQSRTDFKPDVRLSLGSSFYSFYPGMNGFSTWVAPEISMPINNKWTISAGMAYTNIVGTGTPEISGYGSPVQNYGSLFVKGRYQVNDKLSITAMAYKTFNLSPQKPGDKINPRAIDFSNSGGYISFDYKVSNHFHINAAFSMEKRHYNPFDPYGYGSPGFGNSYYGNPITPAVPGGFYPGF